MFQTHSRVLFNNMVFRMSLNILFPARKVTMGHCDDAAHYFCEFR